MAAQAREPAWPAVLSPLGRRQAGVNRMLVSICEGSESGRRAGSVDGTKQAFPTVRDTAPPAAGGGLSDGRRRAPALGTELHPCDGDTGVGSGMGTVRRAQHWTGVSFSQ